MKTTGSVDEYIADTPKEIQAKLTKLRSTILETAPEAKERISYGMPYYDYKGRLIYFGIFKTHIGLFIPGPTIENHKVELKNYKTAKATIHLPLDKEIPTMLIKKLVKDRMKINEENQKNK